MGETADWGPPARYAGLHGFHRYWGKKPLEPLRGLVALLSQPGDVVADPFMGTGAIAGDVVRGGRRFVGGDLNPLAVQLARFQLDPGGKGHIHAALAHLARVTRPEIERTYCGGDGRIATHLLWNGPEIEAVWHRPATGRRRVSRAAQAPDYAMMARFAAYYPYGWRRLALFDNGRINASAALDWPDLFTGRALHNIDLLLHAIRQVDDAAVRRALELTLSAGIGQMSRMVCALKRDGRVDPGSWTMGYWRPARHFECNVWNGFAQRAGRLRRGLVAGGDARPVPMTDLGHVMNGGPAAVLACMDVGDLLAALPAGGVQLFLTDPPHGDRVPYLELSEMWNAMLGLDVAMAREIVVSNARGRDKNTAVYDRALGAVLAGCATRVRPGGFVVTVFNSARRGDWSGLVALNSQPGMTLLGAVPLAYSAGSLAQDMRRGALRGDYVVVHARAPVDADRHAALRALPGWRSDLAQLQAAG
ncbi:DNA methyltransferase [Komagataeibacter saccharivorans]|uniref:DNA methyltransferase n=1 Tax=Komagataeibacter saccharivorans TaxID=265959 RepID=UPI0024A88B3D|nr:DNA methyltransferase [Komagataeibacter saccharivorans]